VRRLCLATVERGARPGNERPHHTELFKQLSDDPMFRRRLAELVFEQTYEQLDRERTGAA
jgi:hypothetical protein